MDSLPSLVLIKMLNYLSFKDRIRCSLVCSNWRSKILMNYRTQASLFLHFDLFPFNLKDSYSNELIRYENSIRLGDVRFLEADLTKLYFKNLKTLTIFNIDQHNDINVLNLGRCVNHFTHLEQLSLTKLRLKERTTLNLFELKVLVLKNVRIDDQLDLNTCSLETLICWSNLDKIRFRHPNKLINLEYKHFNLDFNQEFSNLESLKYFDETGLTRSDFLGNLRKLKKLIAYTPFVEHDLKELKMQKERYKLEKLQLSSFGFRDDFIYFPINYHYIYLLDKFKLKELFNNYSKLSNVSFPVQIDFCSTIDNFLHIPNDFFNKFSQIYQVNVCWANSDLITNFSSLIKFIRNCGFLPKLMLNNCAFEQTFYDQLSLDSSIGQLEIKEPMLDLDNYRFLTYFILFHLKVHLNHLPVDLLKSALLNRNLKYFEFHKQNTKIYIKSHRNLFNLEINHRFVDRFNFVESLIDRLKDDDHIRPLLC